LIQVWPAFITIPGIFIGQPAQQRAGICEDSIAPRRIGLREVIDDLAESDLTGAALDDLGRASARP
jgi:hypothetical protein